MRQVQPEPLEWMFSPFPEFPALGVGGVNPDGDEVISLAYAQVRSWAAPSRRLTKDEMEIWHLAQLNADHYTATRVPVVPAGWRKNERPDFVLQNLSTREYEVGLEFAAFTPEMRRAVEATAIRLRRLLANEASRFEHLAGCRVMLSVVRGDNYDPSPEALNRELRNIDDVVDAIAGLERPNSLLVGDFRDGPPQQLPDGLLSESMVGNVVAHCQEHIPLEIATNHYLFKSPVVHLTFTLTESVETLSNQIRRVVSDHDYDGVSTLVINAGAPDRFGYGYIEDEVLLNFVLERAENLDMFRGDQFRQVLLHFWSTGTIRQVFPEPRTLVEPLQSQHRMQTVVSWDASSNQFRGFRPGAFVL